MRIIIILISTFICYICSVTLTLSYVKNLPYALEVMQAAVESLTPADKPVPTLMVTDLYVRFLPKDSTELAILYDVEKLELFDYPLDYEILVEGDYYHDPSIPERNPTWLYTIVWKETTNSKTTKWTFICNRTEPIFSN